MSPLSPAWREAAITGGIALLLWLVVLLTGGDPRDAARRPLLDQAPERIAVDYGRVAYQLTLDPEHPRLLDGQGRVLGRAWQREARTIANALATCQILRRIELDADADWASYGLADPLQLQVGNRSLSIGGVGIDRGYLREGDALLILDTDLDALLRRPPAALRHPTLDLVGCVGLSHDRGWRLVRTQDRWWLHPGPGTEREWADQELVEAYLGELTAAPVVGFAASPEVIAPRAQLEVERGAGRSTVTLADLGPADAAGGRLIRRQDAHGEEILIVQFDALLLDPPPQRFRSPALLPLDPRQAEELVIGSVRLSRQQDRWLVDGQADIDQQRIDQLLARLAAWQRQDDPPSGETELITIRAAGLRFALTARDPRVLELLHELGSHHLRDRQLLPGFDEEAVSDLIIQPSEGAPVIYTRDPDGSWPAEERSAVESFLTALADARVEEWRGPLDQRDERSAYDSTVTIAVGGIQRTLRLRADGMVAVLDRDLVGLLDPASRSEVLSE